MFLPFKNCCISTFLLFWSDCNCNIINLWLHRGDLWNILPTLYESKFICAEFIHGKLYIIFELIQCAVAGYTILYFHIFIYWRSWHLQIPLLCGSPKLEKMAYHISWISGRTGKHLFLQDHDEGKPPLLLQMVNDYGNLRFMWVFIPSKSSFPIKLLWRSQHSFVISFAGLRCSLLTAVSHIQMSATIVSSLGN